MLEEPHRGLPDGKASMSCMEYEYAVHGRFCPSRNNGSALSRLAWREELAESTSQLLLLVGLGPVVVRRHLAVV